MYYFLIFSKMWQSIQATHQSHFVTLLTHTHTSSRTRIEWSVFLSLSLHLPLMNSQCHTLQLTLIMCSDEKLTVHLSGGFLTAMRNHNLANDAFFLSLLLLLQISIGLFLAFFTLLSVSLREYQSSHRQQFHVVSVLKMHQIREQVEWEWRKQQQSEWDAYHW